MTDWNQYARDVQAASNAAHNKDQKRIKELESKLTKAVDTLREFAKQKAVVELDDHEYNEADFENAYGKFVFKARATLAELEGDNV